MNLRSGPCKNCGRPAEEWVLPPFCEDPAQILVRHTDGGDAMFCFEDERTEEAEL
jgi:hypothetical protein